MSGYLLDTNVLSELVKKQPSSEVVRRLRQARGQRLATSVLCVTELRYGAARHPQGGALWDRILREILSRLEILPVGEEEAVRAGDVLADLERRGQPIGIEDILIATTARAHGLTVVTRNVRHFRRIGGLRVESWWP